MDVGSQVFFFLSALHIGGLILLMIVASLFTDMAGSAPFLTPVIPKHSGQIFACTSTSLHVLLLLLPPFFMSPFIIIIFFMLNQFLLFFPIYFY